VKNGLVVLSHGLESGPQATKVSALAEVARQLGWDECRPDYSDIDAARDPKRIDERIERLLQNVVGEVRPLVFVGSSMGAFISGLASLKVSCSGVFLMAPPIRIDGYSRSFDTADVPTVIVHGWQDELIPAHEVIEFSRARCTTLYMVNDAHRLNQHLRSISTWFAHFLQQIEC
jgi:predicted esterase